MNGDEVAATRGDEHRVEVEEERRLSIDEVHIGEAAVRDEPPGERPVRLVDVHHLIGERRAAEYGCERDEHQERGQSAESGRPIQPGAHSRNRDHLCLTHGWWSIVYELVLPEDWSAKTGFVTRFIHSH